MATAGTAEEDAKAATFLTGVKDESAKKLLLESIPGAGPLIVDYADKLKTLSEHLDVSIANVIKEHEDDFFFAYKTHMYGVHSQFKTLRDKASEQTLRTKRDTKIQALEKELEWFMTESVRLDELCKAQKVEYEKWKVKAQGLDEDRIQLEDTIKKAQRENKVLRSTLEQAERARQMKHMEKAAARAAAKGGAGQGAAPGEQLSAEAELPEPITTYARAVSSKDSGEGVATADHAEGSSLDPKREEAKAQIAEIQAKIEEQKQRAVALRNQLTERNQYKAGYEVLFLESVDEARKHIFKNALSAEMEDILMSEEALVELYEKIFPIRRTPNTFEKKAAENEVKRAAANGTGGGGLAGVTRGVK